MRKPNFIIRPGKIYHSLNMNNLNTAHHRKQSSARLTQHNNHSLIIKIKNNGSVITDKFHPYHIIQIGMPDLSGKKSLVDRTFSE